MVFGLLVFLAVLLAALMLFGVVEWADGGEMGVKRAVFGVVLMALVAGCGGRGSLAPSKAIVGHWATSTGLSDYYVGTRSIVLVDKVLRVDGSYREERKDLTYTVLEANQRDRWIKLQVGTSSAGHVKLLRLEADGESLVESVSLLGVTITDTWRYVDDKLLP